MQVDIKILLKYDLINISRLAELMEPENKENARKKYRNKIKEVQRAKMLEKDWDLLEETLRGLK